jgi:hypothetical protein
MDRLVTEDSPVLLVFDYDPSYMGELQPQAEAFVQHLARKQARIMTLSLIPEGAALAQGVLDDVLEDLDYQPVTEYINLGYVPGESIGIRSLELLPADLQDQSFDGRDLQDLQILGREEALALSDTTAIVVVTGNISNIRWWVEQVSAVERASDVDLNLVAGVSAALEPLARAYHDMESPQIQALVVGLAGAADYERLLDLSDGPAHARLDAQRVGQLTVFVLILVGMLVYGLSRPENSAV